MPVSTRYLFIASMDVEPEFEDLFNEVYDTEHIPALLTVPGVRAISRVKGEAFDFAIAGTIKPVPAPSPIYLAIYEVDGPEVLSSPAWAEACERGRWPTQVRPHTKNRSSCLYRII